MQTENSQIFESLKFGLHENAFLDGFIYLWSHEYLNLDGKFYAASQLHQAIPKYRPEDIEDISRKLNKRIERSFRTKEVIPIATMYAYGQRNNETSKYYGMPSNKISYLRSKIRSMVKDILKSMLD